MTGIVQVFSISTVHAEGEDIEYNTPTDDFFSKTYGDYKDDNVYYHLDYVDSVDLEEQGWLDKLNFVKSMSDGAVGGFYNILHTLFVQFPFMIVKGLTSTVIWLFNLSYDFNVINGMVNKIENSVKNIAGVSSNGTFKTTGLFGGFVTIIAIAIALYTLYQFIVKRASVTAFSALTKALLALTLALVFFANYSTIIKGMNTISTEVAGLVLSGNANTVVNSEGNVENVTVKENMNTSIWNSFVHNPYLMLQYGTMDQSGIGVKRIEKLLELEPNSETRFNYVVEEITEKGNEMMTRGKIADRLLTLVVVLLANSFNAIPLLILSFALTLFQFWFIMMALIAPFVFLWASLPNQFGVLMRYTIELITPLILKVAVSVLALVVFSLTDLLISVSSDGLFGFISLSFYTGILFFTLFLLRKRIMNIFSLGSKELAHVRENMSNAFVQPIKGAVQKGATTTGMALGGLAGGAQGAMIGASVGNSIGKGVTGDQGLDDVARNATMNYMMYDRLQTNGDKNATDRIENIKGKGNESNTNNETPKQFDNSNENINETEYENMEAINNNDEELKDKDLNNVGEEKEEDLQLVDLDKANTEENKSDKANSGEYTNTDSPDMNVGTVHTSSIDTDNANNSSQDETVPPLESMEDSSQEIHERALQKEDNETEQIPLENMNSFDNNNTQDSKVNETNTDSSNTSSGNGMEQSKLDPTTIDSPNDKNSAKLDTTNLDSPSKVDGTKLDITNMDSSNQVGGNNLDTPILDSNNVATENDVNETRFDSNDTSGNKLESPNADGSIVGDSKVNSSNDVNSPNIGNSHSEPNETPELTKINKQNDGQYDSQLDKFEFQDELDKHNNDDINNP